MKRYIIIGALLASAITQAHAQSQSPNPIDNFFHANYDVLNLAEYANRQVGQVSYVLVGWYEFGNVQQRYLDGGYVKLGESDFQVPWGIPYRESATDYAHFIGADAVVYATKLNREFDPAGNEWVGHAVGFYARKYSSGARLSFTAPSSSIQENQIVQAETTLQRTWDRLPTARKNALRADQRAWIQRKDAATDAAKLALIRERTAYLAAQ